MLEVREIRKRFVQGKRWVEVLRGVSFDIGRGELVALMGPSGSGKSTLLQIVGGLDRPSSGSVHFDGKPLGSLGDAELSRFRRRNLGFVFQFFNLVPTLTAIENVALPLLLDGRSGEGAENALASMGLADRAGAFPADLSGGEQQRVALARALVMEPALVLADEPTGSLDSASGESVLAALRRAVGEHGRTVLLVTHDSRVAARADRVIRLLDGVVVPEASPRRAPTERPVVPPEGWERRPPASPPPPP